MFFLTPKAVCTCVRDDYTVRQAVEKMEKTTYTSLPIISRCGKYRGTLTEGDLLWALKNLCNMDMREAENRNIMEIVHRCDNAPVSADTNIEDLLCKAKDQNFVPVIDDKKDFIGLVARKAIVQYFIDHCLGDLQQREA
ncbi:MAG: CBS domain-containing protein [Oscillospiraceae bacterium]|nr:CBS domain-containing protein [Oscillospiraceae bacterium]